MFHRHTKDEAAKHIAVWVLGALSAMIGAWIIGHLDKTTGVTDAGYVMAFFISFIMFLGAGWFWISVAVAVKE